jgi:uncharacterized glyoxalase superfamily protein PhnB
MADPFDALRLPPAPIDPDAEFARALRARLERALRPEQETTMSENSQTTAVRRPPGSTVLAPYLTVSNARDAIDWYQEIFGAEVVEEPIIGDDGRVGHVGLRIGDALLRLSDEHPELGVVSPATLGGTSFALTLYVTDVDDTYRRAIDRGATGVREPEDQFYGSRSGVILDPFGHRWSLQTYLGDDGVTEAGRTQAQDLWNEVGYYTVTVADLDAARRFYGELLGWEFEETNVAPDGGRGAHVRNSRVPFGLHQPGPDDYPFEPGQLHPYIRVADLQAAIQKVEQLGGTVVSVEQYASGGTATCLDDQGARFDLWQPTEGY